MISMTTSVSDKKSNDIQQCRIPEIATKNVEKAQILWRILSPKLQKTISQLAKDADERNYLYKQIVFNIGLVIKFPEEYPSSWNTILTPLETELKNTANWVGDAYLNKYEHDLKAREIFSKDFISAIGSIQKPLGQNLFDALRNKNREQNYSRYDVSPAHIEMKKPKDASLDYLIGTATRIVANSRISNPLVSIMLIKIMEEAVNTAFMPID